MIRANRRGAILIIVVGMVLLMAGICLTFLANARVEANQMSAFSRTIQARIMLAAACSYIQETSRLGWDDPATASHEEAFGWVDVRDGQIGPCTGQLIAEPTYEADGRLVSPAAYRPAVPLNATDAMGRPAWPNIGSISQHPFYRMIKPPYSISPDVAPNAIQNDPARPLFGLPLLRNPDPQPAITSSYAAFAAGDRGVVLGTGGRGWFRLYRDGPATFVITVGSGATQGFRDWREVASLNQESRFVGGESAFDELVGAEVRLWYRIEWSAAINVSVPNSSSNNIKDFGDDAGDWPHHPETGITIPWTTYANQGGTIQWIQRLSSPPEVW